ncbi:MAG: hypothetical protein LAT84_02905 [Balneolia bacterium]|nr:hypothetical protein [Balneolia bacterium]
MSDAKITSTYFAELIRENRTAELNRVSVLLCERMSLFLRTVYKATPSLSDECAQAAFEKVYTGVKSGEIKDLENMFGYCINAVKNEYKMALRKDSKSKEFDAEEVESEGYIQPPDIFDVLSDREREIALKSCVSQLKDSRRDLFLRILSLINTPEKEAAAKLNMSHAQYRTQKSRIISVLRECVSQKLGS